MFKYAFTQMLEGIFYVEHISIMFYIVYAYTQLFREYVLRRTYSHIHMFYILNVYICIFSNVGRLYSMWNILQICSI